MAAPIYTPTNSARVFPFLSTSSLILVVLVFLTISILTGMRWYLNITNHQGNANQNHSELSSHTCQNGYLKSFIHHVRRALLCPYKMGKLKLINTMQIVQDISAHMWQSQDSNNPDLPHSPHSFLFTDLNRVSQSQATGFWGWTILCYGDCPVHCSMFSTSLTSVY